MIYITVKHITVKHFLIVSMFFVDFKYNSTMVLGAALPSIVWFSMTVEFGVNCTYTSTFRITIYTILNCITYQTKNKQFECEYFKSKFALYGCLCLFFWLQRFAAPFIHTDTVSPTVSTGKAQY